jgi:hypothetical protein
LAKLHKKFLHRFRTSDQKGIVFYAFERQTNSGKASSGESAARSQLRAICERWPGMTVEQPEAGYGHDQSGFPARGGQAFAAPVARGCAEIRRRILYRSHFRACNDYARSQQSLM